MKILCLHGVGSSGAIFEAQIANLRRELDPSIELIFVDGPFECNRGPGMLACDGFQMPSLTLCMQASPSPPAHSFPSPQIILLLTWLERLNT
jgi:hypothetical protein